MARFIPTAQRAFVSAASKTLSNGSQSRTASAYSLLQFHPYATSQTHKSPFTANIIRILSNEIEYQHDYAPPHQPATSFNSFTVQDRSGEKWMTMRGKYGENEEIKIEATMFDGCVFVPKPGEDSTGENVVLHISLLVDISKGQGYPDMEFLCSAWPDHLEIQKVYLLNRDKTIINPYMGRDLRRKKNRKLQRTLGDYLEERGVNNELCVFLHEYMMNKDRIELIQWLGNVKSIVQK
ncbi:Mitochondrial glycoprotein family protein [Gossypium australe]|uniref:Mitochondrial glycoprotein family protein n=1 Tax=Gossypium australe TaxID=47621 RepID=A0A5B6X6U7_9ROSI|nr:Mitochondrial glycoprotein family protein [Gossypium australe]